MRTFLVYFRQPGKSDWGCKQFELHPSGGMHVREHAEWVISNQYKRKGVKIEYRVVELKDLLTGECETPGF